jgi:cytosine/adenosine deaminase-related metal-dependent hydrolase
MPPCRLAAEWVLPMSSPPIARGAVLIGAEGRIAAVGPDHLVPRPPDAVEQNYDGGLLLPGLINTHTHLELTGLAGGPPS